MFDRYEIRARISPAILVWLPIALPVAITGVLMIGPAGFFPSLLVPPFAALGAGRAQDLGLRVQPALWSSWGGAPTTVAMRWRENPVHEVTVRHRSISRVTGSALPDVHDEAKNPKEADRIYEAAIEEFRVQVRSSDEYSILSGANADYGFRRNCLGMRTEGIAVAGVVDVVMLVIAILVKEPAPFLVGAGLSFLWSGFWIFVVQGSWVRRKANLYSKRLFETALQVSESGR